MKFVLENVLLRRLREHVIKLKARKYKMFKKEENNLDRIVYADSFRMDPC